MYLPLPQLLSSDLAAICSAVNRGEGFVAVEWGRVVYSCYFSLNISSAEFSYSLSELEDNISRCLGKPILVLGDFNTRSHLWDSNSNLRGNLLAEWADNLGLCLLNEGFVPSLSDHQYIFMNVRTFMVGPFTRRASEKYFPR